MANNAGCFERYLLAQTACKGTSGIVGMLMMPVPLHSLQGPKTVRRYVQECRDLHFDAVELPDACADMLPERDYLLLLDDLQEVIGCNKASGVNLLLMDAKTIDNGGDCGLCTAWTSLALPAYLDACIPGCTRTM